MVLFASAEGVIILFRLAIQDMKEGKMIHLKKPSVSCSCFRPALQLSPPFCPTVFLFTFVISANALCWRVNGALMGTGSLKITAPSPLARLFLSVEVE